MTDSATPCRQWIIDLVRDQYDPTPADWPRHRGWDDGAEAIADAILAQLPLLIAERAGETVLEQSETLDGRLAQTVRLPDGSETVRLVGESRNNSRTADEAFGKYLKKLDEPYSG